MTDSQELVDATLTTIGRRRHSLCHSGVDLPPRQDFLAVKKRLERRRVVEVAPQHAWDGDSCNPAQQRA